jgi:hypothetical protein
MHEPTTEWMHMTLANVKCLGFSSALLAGLLTRVACGSEQARGIT